ncbi:MAG: hypothetical protein M5R40_08850 [Anaerolineae bacterium]|nr:hypothetical protein [Anaerolineae bacterium]
MAKVARQSAGEVRWLRIEDKRLIAPFNERAFALSVMNKPLSLIQRDAVEDVLGRGRFREGEAIAALHAAPQDSTPTLVHTDSLFFDTPYLKAFWAAASRRDRPCQAAFRADDRAYYTYAVPLTRNLVRDRHRREGDIYRVPLWYFPRGVPANWDGSQADPIVISSDYREVGYYSVPEYMSVELGDLVHLLPMRSMLSIESWAHVYYANVIFGIFAIGGRFEKRANEAGSSGCASCCAPCSNRRRCSPAPSWCISGAARTSTLRRHPGSGLHRRQRDHRGRLGHHQQHPRQQHQPRPELPGVPQRGR